MAAEARARVEKKIVHGIERQAGRRERVVELLVAEHLQHGARETLVVAVSARMRCPSATLRGLVPGGSLRSGRRTVRGNGPAKRNRGCDRRRMLREASSASNDTSW